LYRLPTAVCQFIVKGRRHFINKNVHVTAVKNRMKVVQLPDWSSGRHVMRLMLLCITERADEASEGVDITLVGNITARVS